MKASGWPGEGTIELENVYMRYRPELPYTLKGVSFSVADGEKLGVVGRTGAGKSSVMMSILRMVELETGAVRIAGVDTATLSVYEVRRRLGVIPQVPLDTTLFWVHKPNTYGKYALKCLHVCNLEHGGF